MNKIKQITLGMAAGITAAVISVLTVTAAFGAGASDASPERMTPLSPIIADDDTPRYIEGSGGSAAEVPEGSEAPAELSSAADELSLPKKGGISVPLSETNGLPFVYFRQNSEEYCNVPYGYSTIGQIGCGPTAMATVLTSLTGHFVSPITLARFCEEHNLVVGSGTSESLFRQAAEEYGIKYSADFYDVDLAISHLKEGKLLIVTMGKGYFTDYSHFVVLRGVTDDGLILISDPGSEYNTFEKAWTPEFLTSQLRFDLMHVLSP